MAAEIFDVAVIGAGMAGLTCAQALHQAGQHVVVLDKSRGVGGRIATRRLHDTRADHGACYLSPPQDAGFQALVQTLLAADVLRVWTDQVHEFSSPNGLQPPSDRVPRYVAPQGMSAIAKFLTPPLNVRLNCQVTAITAPSFDQAEHQSEHPADYWHCVIADQAPVLARAIALAIPAPQAVTLLQPLHTQETAESMAPFMAQLTAVEFAPCLSVMAGYGPDQLADWQSRYPEVKAITVQNDPVLGWLGLDSSKRLSPAAPTWVLQSSAIFAEALLDAPTLESAAQQMLEQAARYWGSWLAFPDWMQVHRWRYAFPRSPLSQPYLAAPTVLPLVCLGDWCGGRKIEDAYVSGRAIAEFLLRL